MKVAGRRHIVPAVIKTYSLVLTYLSVIVPKMNNMFIFLPRDAMLSAVYATAILSGRYVFGTLGNEANIIIQYYLVPSAFPVTPKYMTLNERDGLFGVKFCFRAGLAGCDGATSENNCVKTNKDRHTVSGAYLQQGL